jgi:septal ring-binding cell division protein DamX
MSDDTEGRVGRLERALVGATGIDLHMFDDADQAKAWAEEKEQAAKDAEEQAKAQEEADAKAAEEAAVPAEEPAAEPAGKSATRSGR